MFKTAAISISPLHSARLHARPGGGLDPQQVQAGAAAAAASSRSQTSDGPDRVRRVTEAERSARLALDAQSNATGATAEGWQTAGEAGPSGYASDFRSDEAGRQLSRRV